MTSTVNRFLTAVTAIIALACHGVASQASPCVIPSFLTLSQQKAFQSFTVGTPNPLMNGLMSFCWSYDLQRNNLTVVLAAKNRGWIGFGISNSGGMADSDVVVFKKDVLGNNIIADMYSEGNVGGVIGDAKQDAVLHGTYTAGVSETFVHVFSRPILTPCDAQDVSLSLTSESNVIVAFGRKLDYGLEFGEAREVEGHDVGNWDTARINFFADFTGTPNVPSTAPHMTCGKREL